MGVNQGLRVQRLNSRIGAGAMFALTNSQRLPWQHCSWGLAPR